MKPQIVLIPGLVSDYRAWNDVEALLTTAGYEVSIADVGLADRLEKMAQQILDSVQGRFIAIGHSMGGRVAFELYRAAPERILGLGLIATGAHPLADGEPAKRQQVIDLANNDGMQALCDVWLPPMLHPETPKINPDIYQSLEQMVLDAGADVHQNQIHALVNRQSAQPLLAELRCPTLFVAGDADAWSSPEQHREMQKLASNAVTRLNVVKDAGHFLQVEKPEEFAGLVIDWIESDVIG